MTVLTHLHMDRADPYARCPACGAPPEEPCREVQGSPLVSTYKTFRLRDVEDPAYRDSCGR